MSMTPGKAKREIAIAVALALLVSLAAYKWQGRVGPGLADEGFLWYGIQQTAQGEVAIRDFQSYDPARYEFCALGSRLWGEGFRGMRKSIAVFQALGLAFGLLILQRVYRNWWLSFIAGLSVYLMFFPQYKSFEPAWAMVLVYACVRLIDSPGVRMHFIAGLAVGFGAFVGRNVGVYGLVGVCALAFYLQATGMSQGGFIKRAGAIALGVLAGYSPMLIMFALNPGMLKALLDSLMLNIQNSATNIGKPVPWPWTITPLPEWMPFEFTLSDYLLGVLFIVMPAYYAVVWGVHLLRRWTLYSEARAAVTASAAIGLPFMHHAFARPDVTHMSEAAGPLVIGALIMPIALGAARSNTARAASAVIVLIISVLVVGIHNPGYKKFAFKGSTVPMTLKGERAEVFAWDAPEFIYALDLDSRVPADEMIFIAPHKPGLYALMGRQSPIREIYMLLNVTDKRQQDMVKELMLSDVRWALIEDSMIDGREDMRFRNQYPIVNKYLTDYFDSIPDEGLPEGYTLYRRAEQ